MAKPINEKRLYNIALFYVSQYEASGDKVRKMLQRRIRRLKMRGETIPDNTDILIESVVQHMRDLGYINDTRFVENLVRILCSQCKSNVFIYQKMNAAGIDSDLVQQILSDIDTPSELMRAQKLVRKRKWGIYRPMDKQSSCRQRDLSALSRAGFSYDIAKTALDTPINS